jgi:hypothetical protein
MKRSGPVIKAHIFIAPPPTLGNRPFHDPYCRLLFKAVQGGINADRLIGVLGEAGE